jgi:hypothetical protein
MLKIDGRLNYFASEIPAAASISSVPLNLTVLFVEIPFPARPGNLSRTRGEIRSDGSLLPDAALPLITRRRVKQHFSFRVGNLFYSPHYCPTEITVTDLGSTFRTTLPP